MARSGALCRIHEDGEPTIREGQEGDCMHVVQEGHVETTEINGGIELRLMFLGGDEPFGEMTIVEQEVRMATVHAMGRARVLTIDTKSFLTRIHDDLSLAYRTVRAMSRRTRKPGAQVAQLSGDSYRCAVPFVWCARTYQRVLSPALGPAAF